jgi:hypothetical protein
MNTTDVTEQSESANAGCVQRVVSTPSYKVTADHPIKARPDKGGMNWNEAVAYSQELIAGDFDNIMIEEEC